MVDQNTKQQDFDFMLKENEMIYGHFVMQYNSVQKIFRIYLLIFGALGTVFGIFIFWANSILLLKGGEVVGPRLGLLAQYFHGFEVSWTGAFIGFF